MPMVRSPEIRAIGVSKSVSCMSGLVLPCTLAQDWDAMRDDRPTSFGSLAWDGERRMPVGARNPLGRRDAHQPLP
jgi:hypothetical protein